MSGPHRPDVAMSHLETLDKVVRCRTTWFHIVDDVEIWMVIRLGDIERYGFTSYPMLGVGHFDDLSTSNDIV